MKKNALLATCLLATAIASAQDSLFKYGSNDSLQNKITYGKTYSELNTLGKYTSYTILKPLHKELRTFLCGTESEKTYKTSVIKKSTDLQNIAPMRQMGDFSGTFKKSNVKYQGWRDEVLIGKIIETILLGERKYKGKIIVDEYTNTDAPIFMWTLKNNTELKAIATYLLKNLVKRDYQIKEKPLLVLNLLEDPELKTLNEADKEFLSELFELVDPTNKDIKNYLKDCKTLYFDIKSNIGACQKYIDENLREGIVRSLEKKFEDFKFKDNVGKIIVALLLFDGIYNHINLINFIKTQFNNAGNLFTPKLEIPNQSTTQPQSNEATQIGGLGFKTIT
ncbi:MAG: hypothetical protein ABIA74_00535 [bacterium]